ncbi:MAG: FkbM family methyltransferase [Bacteroidota bacterium]|nr:FkbM family methyltransferase [Bacteroidota bacterium]
MWAWLSAEGWWPMDPPKVGGVPPKVLDVGSEEGDFTALYASWGADVAFIDPSMPWITQTIDTLRANDLDVGPSFTGLVDDYNYIEGKRVEERRFVTMDEKVARIRLDTFCEWFDFWPDAVTMDIEGAELQALRGAPMLLSENVVWWISVHECDPHALNPSKVHEFMRERGFKDQWLGSLGEHHYRFWRP